MLLTREEVAELNAPLDYGNSFVTASFKQYRKGLTVGELIKELERFDKQLYVVVPTFDIANHEWLNDNVYDLRSNEHNEVEIR